MSLGSDKTLNILLKRLTDIIWNVCFESYNQRAFSVGITNIALVYNAELLNAGIYIRKITMVMQQADIVIGFREPVLF